MSLLVSELLVYCVLTLTLISHSCILYISKQLLVLVDRLCDKENSMVKIVYRGVVVTLVHQGFEVRTLELCSIAVGDSIMDDENMEDWKVIAIDDSVSPVRVEVRKKSLKELETEVLELEAMVQEVLAKRRIH